jgi:putative ABC transport system substrate-binding protein
MATGIGRRGFVIGLGGTTVAWPLIARAEPVEQPVIGFLSSLSRDAAVTRVKAFRRGLADGSFSERQNVAMESRWANGQYGLLPGLVADLVARRVNVIVASGGPPATLAAAAATTAIPIVFVSGIDPIAAGLTKSFNHPTKNVTGFMLFTAAGWTKRLELAAQIAAKDSVIGILLNSENLGADPPMKEMEQAAQTLGRQLLFVSATTSQEIETALKNLAELQVGALIVSSDPFFVQQIALIVTRVAGHKLPVVCEWSDEARAGALMSYGIDLIEAYHQAGVYTARLLKGEPPSDLPIVQPTKFEFVINLKTAKALGLTVPSNLLTIADEVIE